MKKAIFTLLVLSVLCSPLTTYAYDPRYLFTDQEKDTESGLYNFDAREYNPSIGRFIQPDPVLNNLPNPQALKQQTGQDLQEFLKDPQSLNSYGYARNNPVRYVDPMGEWFGEFFTFRQSWPSFQSELGEASIYLGPTWQKAIDHPYITGAMTGIAGGLAALGGSYLLGQGGLVLWRIAPITGSPLVRNVDKAFNKLNRAARGAYDIAASGGKHAGFLNNAIKTQNIEQMKNSINSLCQRALEHLNWIKNPMTYKNYESEFKFLSEFNKNNAYKSWYNEAQRYITEANVLKGYLENLNK